MMKVFEMPVVNVERFDVTDVVTTSGVNLEFGAFTEEGALNFDVLHGFVGGNDTRLG